MESLNFLIIDTTTSDLKIGLQVMGKKINRQLDGSFKHVENIIPGIKEIFSQINQCPADVDYIGVCNGPGSFTGIRIGIATALGLSLARKTPCFGFSLFEVYAYLLAGRKNCVIIPVVDAKKKRFYCSFIQDQCPITIYDISSREIINKALQYLEQGSRLIFAGQDFALIENEAARHCSFEKVYASDYSAEQLLEYGQYHLINKKITAPDPIYLRKSEAEIALLKQQADFQGIEP